MAEKGVEAPLERVEALYRQEAPRIWRALTGFTGNPEMASDALSEAFARALAHQDTIRNLSAWVWVVAFRIAADDMRRPAEVSDAPFHQAYELEDPLPDLVAALRKLPPRQRLAIILHDYADRPVQEIAEVFGSTRATTYVHLSKGRRRLRKLLEVHDG